VVVPVTCTLTATTLQKGIGYLKNLEIRPEKMMENLENTKGFIFSEPVMMRIAEKLGKESARKLTADLIAEARKSGSSLKSILERNEHLSMEEIEKIFNYDHFLEPVSSFVRKMTQNYTRRKDP